MADDPSLPVWLRQQIHADRARHESGWYGDTHWKALRRRAATLPEHLRAAALTPR